LRPKLNFVVLDPSSGRAQPGAWVSIYLANTLTLTTLWADDDVSTLANPVQANQLGQVAMRVNPGVYDVSMVWDGATPTVVEDVLAWTPETAIITSPGDLIVGGTTGAPTRLPAGSSGTVLTTEVGIPSWQYLGSGHGLPTGPAGTMLTYSSTGPVALILPGTQDQALAMAGGVPTWVSSLIPPGTTLPISQPGDLVVGAVGSGLPARLARGAPGTVLTSDAGGVSWHAEAAVARGVGQCRLHRFDDTTLGLIPWHGEHIWVNGGSRVIPVDGVPLSRTGLVVETQYQVYAAWDGAALSLEASTTGWEGTGGLTHKIGDVTRTLVGMIYASGTTEVFFIDTQTARYVISHFNPYPRQVEHFFRAPRSTSSTTPVEVHDEIRAHFLTWGWNAVEIALDGMVIVAPNSSATTYLALDATLASAAATDNSTAWPITGNIAQAKTIMPSWGRHWVTLYGATTGATQTWQGDINDVSTCRVHAVIDG
jgi:hypothetical protein